MKFKGKLIRLIILSAVLMVVVALGWRETKRSEQAFGGDVAGGQVSPIRNDGDGKQSELRGAALAPAVAQDEASGGRGAAHTAAIPEVGATVAASTNVKEAKGFTFDASEAFVTTAAGEIRLQSSEGLFDRLNVAIDEPLEIRVRLPELVRGLPVTINAIEGGLIERTEGPLAFNAKGDEKELKLKFTPTLGRGRYAVAIRHSGSVAIIPFWAGPENPVGSPGPNYADQTSNSPK